MGELHQLQPVGAEDSMLALLVTHLKLHSPIGLSKKIDPHYENRLYNDTHLPDVVKS